MKKFLSLIAGRTCKFSVRKCEDEVVCEFEPVKVFCTSFSFNFNAKQTHLHLAFAFAYMPGGDLHCSTTYSYLRVERKLEGSSWIYSPHSFSHIHVVFGEWVEFHILAPDNFCFLLEYFSFILCI